MRTLLLSLFLTLGSTEVRAGAKAAEKATEKAAAAEAEYTRLQEELRGLAARAHWAGVDETYARMTALEGVTLSLEDHLRGIEAAEALGRPDREWPRVRAALTLTTTDELLDRYARLLVFYGEAELSLAKDFTGSRQLQVVSMPLDPAQRRVIEQAQLSLEQSGQYQGLLPLGQYRVGDTAFDIVGGPTVVVTASPSDPAAQDSVGD